uniref:AGC-kinase C-terminal domain-containing protein n=1 Tax=Megaselia scalaris TaxID=36166 RepID=T1GET3_MEGSC
GGGQAPEEIKGHSFFRAIEWEKVENREEEPPFVPALKGRKDLAHFDTDFTAATTDLTPTDKLFMMNLDQTDFIGFSYLNPEFLTYA